jgi:hypothetical protein
MNGTPLLVVAKNLGHADTRMVEMHYGHLAPSFIANAIRAGAPRYRVKTTSGWSAEVARLSLGEESYPTQGSEVGLAVCGCEPWRVAHLPAEVLLKSALSNKEGLGS